MRALNIIHVFRAPLGGLFRHVVDLVRGQIARGHHVGIVADSLTGNARADEIFRNLAPALALGISLTPMPRPLSPLDIPAALHVTKRVRQTGADVVHGHGAKGGAYARLAIAKKRIVRAYTPHGGSLLLNHATLSGKAYLAMERVLMSRGDLYLFESAYSADIFRAKIGNPQGLVRIVHNGISKPEFEPVALAADASDIVFVGEYRPVKGIDTLIDAIAVLHNGGQALTATLVGDGPEAQALKAQVADAGLDDAIHFVPAMPMRPALALGRVVVLPSRAESLPYVVLEAAAAARPLITTRVGGIPEIYGPLADALVPAGDVAALAKAIAAIFADPPAAEAQARQLRAQIADSFSADAMVDSVLAGYQQALELGASSGRPAVMRV